MNNIKLYNDDCMNILPSLVDGSITLTLTDIPYDEVNRKSGGLRNLDKSHADIITFPLDKFIDEIVRVTSGSIYIFCGSVQVSHIRNRLIEHGLSVRHCIWEKTNPSPMNGQYMWLSSIENCVYARKKGAYFDIRERCKSAVWKCPTAKYKGHPTPKPIELMERLIQASSQPEDTVFDPCMGSGAVGIAAKRTRRNFIGVEFDKNYYSTTQDRIDKAVSGIGEKKDITSFL
jgi:site-specific DNA-methyltransferase (adenine-specific)